MSSFGTRFCLLGFLCLLGVGCKPKPGDACSKPGKEVCQDAVSALVCQRGTWKTMACRGSQGCVMAGDTANCDNMLAEPGEVCSIDADLACAVDRQSFLQCTNGTWAKAGACRGQAGCQATTKQVKCDTTIARPDDPCMKEDEGDYACSEDHRAALICRGGKFQVASKCIGPKACEVKPQGVECDDSVSEVGDSCELADHYACSKDSRFILVCRQGKFQEEKNCRPKLCKVQGDKVGCL